ncbi:MAG TPA: septal ring lytic transglycosylase RlpA family protein [Flavitalea sp.]|nr:septal ring lytic transglycosylase RlpA family protein [Flavitalea sp.]
MKQLLIIVFLFTTKLAFAGDIDTLKNGRVRNKAKIQYGTASYYSNKFKGKPTASGQLYDPAKLTAAHNGLPMNTWIKVINQRNKKWVIVKVNDRLHKRNTRLVDLSYAAAKKLGATGHGLIKVKLEVLSAKQSSQLASK